MNIKGAIFDIDGTVLDSMQIWDSVGANYLRSLGIEPEEGLSELFKTMSMAEGARYYQDVYHVSYSTEEIIDGVNRMVEQMYFELASPKEDAKEFLSYLKAHNVLVCAATSTDEYLVKAALERNDMLHYFSKIFTCTEIGKGKTEPDIFDAALKHLGISKEDAIIFEDSLYAIKTAKKAGYKVAGIYDVHENNQEEIKALSDFYFTQYAEIKNLL